MREAVARIIDPVSFAYTPADFGFSGEDDPAWERSGGYGFRDPALKKADAVLSGPIASEIARLTGERDAARFWSENADLIAKNEWLRSEGLVERLRAAEAETARLRAGIQAMIDGNYDHPRRHRPGQCRHGIYFYDECGSCTDEALAALLTSQEKTDV